MFARLKAMHVVLRQNNKLTLYYSVSYQWFIRWQQNDQFWSLFVNPFKPMETTFLLFEHLICSITYQQEWINHETLMCLDFVLTILKNHRRYFQYRLLSFLLRITLLRNCLSDNKNYVCSKLHSVIAQSV